MEDGTRAITKRSNPANKIFSGLTPEERQFKGTLELSEVSGAEPSIFTG